MASEKKTAAAARPKSRSATIAPAAARLLSELRKVRRNPGNEDAVHDARVAGRRLIAVSELWLPASPARNALRARLDRTVSRLGRVRNLDVVARLLSEKLQGLAAPRLRLLAWVRKRRRAARRELAAWLTVGKVRKLKDAVLGALKGLRRGIDRGTPAPRDLAPRLRRILELAGRGDPTRDPERAHEIRIQLRLLRYAHDSLESEYAAADFQATRALFVRLQETAGDWHDREILDRLAVKAIRRKKLKEGAAEFRARLKQERTSLAAAFAAALAELPGRAAAIVGGPLA